MSGPNQVTEIVLDGRNTKVTVAGIDVTATECLRSIQLVAEPGEVPQLDLEMSLPWRAVVVDREQTHVTISGPLRDLLLALGWAEPR